MAPPPGPLAFPADHTDVTGYLLTGVTAGAVLTAYLAGLEPHLPHELVTAQPATALVPYLTPFVETPLVRRLLRPLGDAFWRLAAGNVRGPNLSQLDRDAKALERALADRDHGPLLNVTAFGQTVHLPRDLWDSLCRQESRRYARDEPRAPEAVKEAATLRLHLLLAFHDELLRPLAQRGWAHPGLAAAVHGSSLLDDYRAVFARRSYEPRTSLRERFAATRGRRQVLLAKGLLRLRDQSSRMDLGAMSKVAAVSGAASIGLEPKLLESLTGLKESVGMVEEALESSAEDREASRGRSWPKALSAYTRGNGSLPLPAPALSELEAVPPERESALPEQRPALGM